MDAVIRAIEARYAGTRVVALPYRTPDDPAVRFWLRVLHVRERDLVSVEIFGDDFASELYGKRPLPFILTSYGARNTAHFLAEQKAARRSRAYGMRVRRVARVRVGRGVRRSPRPGARS